MEKKVDIKQRIALVKAMEFVVRQINDDDVFMPWLSVGVADGDIPYESIVNQVTEEEIKNLDYWAEDDNFRDLIECFLRRMKGAIRSGGLYCNWICGSLEN